MLRRAVHFIIVFLAVFHFSIQTSTSISADTVPMVWGAPPGGTGHAYRSSPAAACAAVCSPHSVTSIGSPRPNPFNSCVTEVDCKCSAGYGFTFARCPDTHLRAEGCGRIACVSTIAEATAMGLMIGPRSCLRCPSDNECSTPFPVQPSTGQKLEQIVDFAFGGEKQLAVERIYSSNTALAAEGSIAVGWSFAFDHALTAGTTSAAFLRYPDGTMLELPYDSGSSSYFPLYNPQTVRAVRLTSPAVHYEVTFEDDRYVKFEKNSGGTTPNLYRPTLIRDRSGYEQTISRDATGRVTGITDNLGRSVSFTWTGEELTQVSAPGGITIAYTYDYAASHGGSPDITTKRLLTASVSDGTSTETTTYHYEDTTWVYALTGITDARGVRYKTVVYDAHGRVSESGLAGGDNKTTFAYDAPVSGIRTVTLTNALTKQSKYKFQSVAGASRLVGVDGVASANCPASFSQIAYDANGALAQTTDEEGRIIKYTNDARGLPTSITRGFGAPEATTTTYTYHATLRVPTQKVEPNLTTSYTWDAVTNRLTSRTETDTTSHTVPYPTNGQTRTWAFTYSTSAGLLASVDGPLAGSGDTVSYTYDANGYLASVTDEVGLVTTVNTVNTRGQPTRITDPNGVITDLVYDVRGRLTSTTVNPGGSAAVTSFEYNAVDDITKLTRPDGAEFVYAYNNPRRLTSVTALDGQKIEYTHDLLGNVTTTTIKNSGGSITYQLTQTYDEIGRLLKQIGANTQETVYSYEKNDNLKSVTDPRNEVYSYAYDAVNRLIRETNPASYQVNLTRDGQDNITVYSDPRSLTTSYVRNGFGEVIRSSSPDSGITDYVRDARGLVTQVTDGRGVVASMTYDNAGRILTRTFPSASAEDMTFIYDSVAGGNNGKGRLTSATHQGGSVARIYDVRGNITTETRVIGGQTYVTEFAYDAADQVTLVTYPSGRQVGYVRDTMGRVTTVRTRKPAAGAWIDVATSIVYRPLSTLVASFTHGNGLTTTNTHSLDYELTQCEVKDGVLALIDKSYARSDKLNITSIADNVTPANSQSLWYNRSNWLQNADGPWGQKIFYYDGVGNRTYEITTPPSGPTTTEIAGYPSSSNRIDDVIEGSTTLRTFTHDGAGNIVTDVRGGSTYAYGYNARGRLATVTQDSTLKGTYLYNSLEQLASRVVTNSGAFNGTYHTVQDIFGNIIAEADGTTGTPLREYIWLPKAGYAGTDLPVGVVDAAGTGTPELLYVHADHLGRPIQLTDGSKATVWAVEWLPWGGVHAKSGPQTLDARFPGQWFQVENGLHYNWHRHYDSTLGRYTQPDPLGFIDGPSVFAYARNAPAEYVDPEGRNIPAWPFVRTAAAACYRALFAQGSGLLNANRYLRIGEGRKGGEIVFRAAGSAVERITGKKHIDFWRVRSLNK